MIDKEHENANLITSTNRWGYNGKEKQTIRGLNFLDYGNRMYDDFLGRWFTQDPLQEKFYSISSYVFCGNNPLRFIDPTGLAPIYAPDGTLLGTDDNGLQGNAIIMNRDNFIQGMSNKDAMKYNLGLTGLSNQDAIDRYTMSFEGLKDRPDWDGKLTLEEANDWYRNGNGQPLFVDVSKIDLLPQEISDFKVGESKYVNYQLSLNFETGMVYGTIKITKIDEKGTAQIGNIQTGLIDKYDFNKDGRFFRDIATSIGKYVAGNGTGYNIYGYGIAKLVKWWPPSFSSANKYNVPYY
jgi:RHS repeat-associated protein